MVLDICRDKLINYDSDIFNVGGNMSINAMPIPKLSEVDNLTIGYNTENKLFVKHIQLVTKYQVTSSNLNMITFDNLSLNKGEYLIIFWSAKSTTTAYIRLFVNGDTTTTNYYTQAGTLTGTSWTNLGRANDAYIMFGSPYPHSCYLYLTLDLDNYPRAFNVCVERGGGAGEYCILHLHSWTRNVTTTSISSISFTTTAGYFTTDSVFYIYKVSL